MSKSILVIGGGIGGLAAAIRLAVAGFGVTLLEKNPRVGGKLNIEEVPHPHRLGQRPFRFDTGPSLMTMPAVFEDLFAAAGKRMEDRLSLMPLDPIARYSWPDGTIFEARANPEDRLSEVRAIAPGDADGFLRLMDKGKAFWDLAAETFLHRGPQQLRKEISRSPAKMLRSLSIPFRIGMFQNFAKLVNRHVAHPKLRELFYQYATYSGASPFKAPATLAVIPHAEFAFGGWYPRGGMYRIAEELERLALDLGVRIHTNCPVWKIDIDGSGRRPQVTGAVCLGGERFAADAVVANCDVVYAYRHLIDGSHRPRYDDAALNALDPGGSAMALMLGVDGTYPQLAHHNKFMPMDFASDLRAMFELKALPDDPCIYVCASTRTDAGQAPDGCENLYVMASAPALDGKLDWNVEAPRYEARLIEQLEHRWGLRDLRRRIVVRKRLTPADLQSFFNANAGSIYGIGSNSRRAAFLRPPNRDEHIRGLYFAGGATHPGGGLPLVALSGKIVSELVREDLG